MKIGLSPEERAVLQAVRDAGDEVRTAKAGVVHGLVRRQLLCALDDEPWALTAAGLWALQGRELPLRTGRRIPGIAPEVAAVWRINGLRWCSGCRRWHPAAMMVGKKPYCREQVRAIHRASYARRAERINAARRKTEGR